MTKKSEQKIKNLSIVHDWLTNMGGAEQVVINFHRSFPTAPIYTLFYTPSNLSPELQNLDVHTSFLQKDKPVLKHQKYFPLMPLAWRKMELENTNVILSSSSSCAKGVKKPKNAIHICYIHTPMRYAYEFEDEYLEKFGSVKKLAAKILIFFIRAWDKKNSKKVDLFIANSHEVANRVKKHYHRDAIVINAPVRVDKFAPSENTEDYYVAFSRLVKYKRIELAISACKKLGRKLYVLGDGEERENLERLAYGKDYDKVQDFLAKNSSSDLPENFEGHTIRFFGRVSDEDLRKYLSECKALIFPAYEDFGIAPVEAEASGRPVIAYKKGGALDTVKDGETGVFFEKQTTNSVAEAIEKFEKMNFDSNKIRKHAETFSEENFRTKIETAVSEFLKNPKISTDKLQKIVDRSVQSPVQKSSTKSRKESQK